MRDDNHIMIIDYDKADYKYSEYGLQMGSIMRRILRHFRFVRE
jgi:hypothetical protein